MINVTIMLAKATTESSSNVVTADPRAIRILARSMYKELEANGYDPKQIVAVATELIGEVTNRINPSNS